MDIYNYIKNEMTERQVIEVMQELGSDFKKDNNGNLKFKTICHQGNSYKLYYFSDSKKFRCFTECQENFSIIDLIMKVKRIEKKEAIYFLKKFLNISSYKKIGFSNKHLIDDWDYLNKYDKKNVFTLKDNKIYDHSVLNLFPQFNHESWHSEDIFLENVEKFNIRFDIGNNRIVIPHYNINNELIGIRVRNLDLKTVEDGYKYMPMEYNAKFYTHKLQYNLYGLNENLEAIKRMGKIMLFESEKSVIRAETYYKNNNFTVATCGSSISSYQRDLIISLGIREVFLAYDKEYTKDNTEESEKYSEKILKKAHIFSPYCTVYILWDSDDLLDFKNSPIDKGKEILEKIMKSKYEIKTVDK